MSWVSFVKTEKQHNKQIQLKTEEQVFLVQKYYERKSLVQALFKQDLGWRFINVTHLVYNHTTNVAKYQLNGTSLNLSKGRSGRRHT